MERRRKRKRKNQLINKLEPVELSEEEQDKLEKIEDRNEVLDYLKDSISQIHVNDETEVEFLILSLLSLNKGIGFLMHSNLLGDSRSGKSHLHSSIMQIVPREMRFPIHAVSPKFLIYLGREYDFHKTVINLDDVQEKDIEILKILGSNNPFNQPSWGTIQQGQPKIFVLNAQPLIMFSRVSPLRDEDDQLTKRYFNLVIKNTKEREKTIKEFNRVKKPMKFEDPIAEEIIRARINLRILNVEVGSWEPPENLSITTSQFFLALLKSHALLNFPNREIKQGELITTEEDYSFASQLFRKLEIYELLKIDDKSWIIWNAIPDEEPLEEEVLLEEEGTIRGLQTITGFSPATLKRRLKDLYNRGMIDRESIKTGGRPKYYHWKNLTPD